MISTSTSELIEAQIFSKEDISDFVTSFPQKNVTICDSSVIHFFSKWVKASVFSFVDTIITFTADKDYDVLYVAYQTYIYETTLNSKTGVLTWTKTR